MTPGPQAPEGENPRLGRYELLGEVGRGGMGVVYRALDPTIGRNVAVKTVRLSEHGSQEEIQSLRMRLLRESQAAGQLSHPNIVPIFDYGEQQDVAYIVMEYVSGRTLEQALEEDPAIRSSPVALGILADCARALDYAHGKGIVHRDVKPGNIMLQHDGTVKIADFGIAKVLHSSALTMSAMMVGSPYYMAPEQLKSETVSGRTDQYALASVAYAMLTGRRPFEADSMATLITRTLFEEPPAVPTLNPMLGMEVDSVLRKALAKDPAARYGSCTEFIDALRTALTRPALTGGDTTIRGDVTDPTRLAVPTPPPRSKSRVPLILGAVVLLVLALATAAGVYLYQANQAARTELAYWDSVKDSKDQAQYASYIQRYPNGQFASLARAKMAELKIAPPAALSSAPGPSALANPTQPTSASKSTPQKTGHATTGEPVSQPPLSSGKQTATQQPPAPQPTANQGTAPSKEDACRPGLTEIAPDRFQGCLETMSKTGFSPAALTAYDKDDGTTLLIVAFQRLPNRRATFLVPANQRTEILHRMENEGYRPEAVSVLNSGHHHTYSELWVPRAAPFTVRVFENKQDFDGARQKYESDGYMIRDLVPYRVGNDPRYSVIWVKQPGADTIAESDLTPLDLRRRTETLNSQGYRMSRISGYHGGSGRRFAAVWERPQGSTVWEVNMTRDNLFKMHSEMLAKGYHLHHVSFVNGSFAAVWWN